MIKNYNELLYDNETIETKRTVLRKFKKSDAEDVLEYGSDEETLKYLIWGGVETLDEAKTSITDYYWSKPGIYAIELKKNNKCIGAVDLRIEPDHEKASFGYMLNRKYWGNGYMTEVMSAILNLCFEKLELNRVEATHFAGNEGSGKVMANCGMKCEGVGKKEQKMKGVFRDVVHYGITKETWDTENHK